MPNIRSSAEVLEFWFTECSPEQWFTKDDGFDRTLATRFGDTVDAGLAGRLDAWADDADGCLALVLVLDQFTRNIHRDTPRAFAGDEMALALSLRCVDRGHIDDDDPNRRTFMLMPMMHSEDIEVQERSLPLFKKHTPEHTYDYAIRHRDIVKRFARFPHRNAILGRPSTHEETEFLKQPNSSF